MRRCLPAMRGELPENGDSALGKRFAMINVVRRAFTILSLVFTLIVISNRALAQGMGSCPMCGPMGWTGMILGGVLVLALIAALIALTVFLVRRSRQGSHP